MGDAPDTLGERLQGLRQAQSKSQEEVAQAIPVNSGTYSRWERGTSKPHADQIAKLARYFGCTTDYILLGGTLTEQEMPLELHRFLATKWGRYAHKRNLVGMLRQIRLMPDGHPPTVKGYTRFVRTWALNEDEDVEEYIDKDPPKKAH